MSELPPRQLQVLQLISQGTSLLDAARVMRISHSSVKTHKQRLFDHLGVNTGPHAVRVAYRRGYLAVDPDVLAAATLLRASTEWGYRLALVPWEEHA